MGSKLEIDGQQFDIIEIDDSGKIDTTSMIICNQYDTDAETIQ